MTVKEQLENQLMMYESEANYCLQQATDCLLEIHKVIEMGADYIFSTGHAISSLESLHKAFGDYNQRRQKCLGKVEGLKFAIKVIERGDDIDE